MVSCLSNLLCIGVGISCSSMASSDSERKRNRWHWIDRSGSCILGTKVKITDSLSGTTTSFLLLASTAVVRSLAPVLVAFLALGSTLENLMFINAFSNLTEEALLAISGPDSFWLVSSHAHESHLNQLRTRGVSVALHCEDVIHQQSTC